MATTTNFGWETPDDTDLVKDGALAMRTLGNSIDTSMADLKGGTSGQILSKNSNTDMDFVWINNDQGDITAVNVTSPITGGGTSGAVTVGIQDGTTAQKGAVQLENSTSSTSTTTAAVPASVKSAYDLANAAIPKSTVTTNGDLIYGTGSATVTRLGVGSTGQVLTVSGGVPTWATPASGNTHVGCKLYKSSAQSIPNNSFTLLTFDSEVFDTDGFHSTSSNTERITIPTGKGGKYGIFWQVGYVGNATGFRNSYIGKNGSTAAVYGNIIGVPSGDSFFSMNYTVLDLAAGDYIQMYTGQTSGGNLNTQADQAAGPTFGVTYLGA